MPTINDLRQQAATIKNATQVGENTATRVGTTFETIADLLEGASVGQGVPSVDLSQLNALRTPADQTTANPTIYNVTTLHNLSSTTIKVGTLFIFSDGGRAVVTQILLSNYQVDGGGNISSPNTSQITMYYRMFNIVQETWSAWTLYAGGGGGGTIDPYPVSGSDNAVASNGVFERLQKAAPEVDINDIDDLDDYVNMQTGEASTYTIKAYHNLSSTWLRVGVLMVFANQANNTLTQICISNCMVDGGGNLIPNYTTNVMNVFYRFKQFSGNPPEGMTIGVWTTWAKFGDSGYQPDNEDIDLNASDQLQFANKLYDASAFSGLGRVYLRKNIVTSGGVEKNVLTQAMVNTANTIYHIQYDYDLNGQTITLPAGCVLELEGGTLSNGTLNGNNTTINSDVLCIKKDVIVGGTWANEIIYTKWFEFISSQDGTTDNSLCFKQLQNIVNGTKGCKVEFTKGYYQTQIIGMQPEGYVEIDGVTYPRWAMNTYQQDDRVVFRVSEIPYIDINLNGSTIQMINVTCPAGEIIRINGVANSYVHDGTLIGMAINNFSYPDYANYNWQTLGAPVNDYEWCYLVNQCGGFGTFYNLNLQYATGDGIVVGSGSWYFRTGDVRPSGVVSENTLVQFPAKGYVVKDCEISYCGRNGITCHGSDEGNIVNCHIHNIGSDAGDAEIGTDGVMGRRPRAGIDVEFEDGQGLKPVMNWDGLYIHDCGQKSFTFATGSQSKMKQFLATNCRFITLGLTNNINAEGTMEFLNCYFEHNWKEGSLYGTGAVFRDCQIIAKALALRLGTHVFENCIITDEYTGADTSTYFFIEAINKSVFRNCTITIKHPCGYISDKTFYNCTLNFYHNGIVYAMGAEFYDCVFHNDPDDATNYSFQFRTGNNAGSTRGHIILERCVLEKARGHGTGVNDFFFSVDNYPVVIKDCQFTRSLSIYHGSPCGVISIQGSKFKTLYINGYQQTTAGVVPVTINGCDIETITIWSSNALQIEIDNSIVGITTTQYVLKNVLFRKCIVSNNIARTTAAYKDVGVKGIDTIFDFAYTANTDNYNLENCYIKGVVTEANYTGTKNACSFETPLPTRGTTAQRPSASVAGVGFKYFDTDLDKPVYSDGTSWLDGTGAPASNSLKLLSISQNDYDNLGTYDSSTLYVITSS